MKYTQQYEGEPFRPAMKGWRMRCCDCGLVHVVNFRIVEKGKRVELVVSRDKRATAAHRRRKGIRISKP